MFQLSCYLTNYKIPWALYKLLYKSSCFKQSVAQFTDLYYWDLIPAH